MAAEVRTSLSAMAKGMELGRPTQIRGNDAAVIAALSTSSQSSRGGNQMAICVVAYIDTENPTHLHLPSLTDHNNNSWRIQLFKFEGMEYAKEVQAWNLEEIDPQKIKLDDTRTDAQRRDTDTARKTGYATKKSIADQWALAMQKQPGIGTNIWIEKQDKNKMRNPAHVRPFVNSHRWEHEPARKIEHVSLTQEWQTHFPAQVCRMNVCGTSNGGKHILEVYDQVETQYNRMLTAIRDAGGTVEEMPNRNAFTEPTAAPDPPVEDSLINMTSENGENYYPPEELPIVAPEPTDDTKTAGPLEPWQERAIEYATDELPPSSGNLLRENALRNAMGNWHAFEADPQVQNVVTQTLDKNEIDQGTCSRILRQVWLLRSKQQSCINEMEPPANYVRAPGGYYHLEPVSNSPAGSLAPGFSPQAGQGFENGFNALAQLGAAASGGLAVTPGAVSPVAGAPGQHPVLPHLGSAFFSGSNPLLLPPSSPALQPQPALQHGPGAGPSANPPGTAQPHLVLPGVSSQQAPAIEDDVQKLLDDFTLEVNELKQKLDEEIENGNHWKNQHASLETTTAASIEQLTNAKTDLQQQLTQLQDAQEAGDTTGVTTRITKIQTDFPQRIDEAIDAVKNTIKEVNTAIKEGSTLLIKDTVEAAKYALQVHAANLHTEHKQKLRDELDGQVTQITNQHKQEMQLEFAALKTEFEQKLNQTLGDSQAKADQIKTELTEHSNKLHSARQAQTAYEDKIGTLTHTQNTTSASVGSVKNDLNTIKLDVTEVKNSINSTKQTATSVKAVIDGFAGIAKTAGAQAATAAQTLDKAKNTYQETKTLQQSCAQQLATLQNNSANATHTCEVHRHEFDELKRVQTAENQARMQDLYTHKAQQQTQETADNRRVMNDIDGVRKVANEANQGVSQLKTHIENNRCIQPMNTTSSSNHGGIFAHSPVVRADTERTNNSFNPNQLFSLGSLAKTPFNPNKFTRGAHQIRWWLNSGDTETINWAILPYMRFGPKTAYTPSRDALGPDADGLSHKVNGPGRPTCHITRMPMIIGSNGQATQYHIGDTVFQVLDSDDKTHLLPTETKGYAGTPYLDLLAPWLRIVKLYDIAQRNARVEKAREALERMGTRVIAGQWDSSETTGDIPGKRQRDPPRTTPSEKLPKMPDMSIASIDNWKTWTTKITNELDIRIRNGDNIQNIMFAVRNHVLDETSERHRVIMLDEENQYTTTDGLIELIRDELHNIVAKRTKLKTIERNRMTSLTTFTDETNTQVWQRFRVQLKRSIDTGLEFRESELLEALKSMFEKRNPIWVSLRETAMANARENGRTDDQLYISDFDAAVKRKFSDETTTIADKTFEEKQRDTWAVMEQTTAAVRTLDEETISQSTNLLHTINNAQTTPQTGNEGQRPQNRRPYVPQYDRRKQGSRDNTYKPRSRAVSPNGNNIETARYSPHGRSYFVKKTPRVRGTIEDNAGDRIHYSNQGAFQGYDQSRKLRQERTESPWTPTGRYGRQSSDGIGRYRTFSRTPSRFRNDRRGRSPGPVRNDRQGIGSILGKIQYKEDGKVYYGQQLLRNNRGFLTPRGNRNTTPGRQHAITSTGARGDQLNPRIWDEYNAETKDVVNLLAALETTKN